MFSVAATPPCPYANILDLNHRDRVGLVVQQDGTKTNRFVFGVGDGVSFLPGSTATAGYNANYGRYFNGLVSYAYVRTPVTGSR